MKNWENSCFSGGCVFAACCFQPSKWVKWAPLPHVHCCNPHVSVRAVQREKRHTHLCVAVVTKDWACSVSREAKGLCWRLGAVECLPRLQSCGCWPWWAAGAGRRDSPCCNSSPALPPPHRSHHWHITQSSAAKCNRLPFFAYSSTPQTLLESPLFWQNCCHLSHFSGACRKCWTEPRSFCFSSALGIRHIVPTACLLHSPNILRQRMCLTFPTAWTDILRHWFQWEHLPYSPFSQGLTWINSFEVCTVNKTQWKGV